MDRSLQDSPNLRPAQARWTAQRVRDFLLSYPGDDADLIEILAIACSDVIEERDAERKVRNAAIDQLHMAQKEVDRLKGRLCSVLEERRQERVAA
jgi:hypothetical protein